MYDCLSVEDLLREYVGSGELACLSPAVNDLASSTVPMIALRFYRAIRWMYVSGLTSSTVIPCYRTRYAHIAPSALNQCPQQLPDRKIMIVMLIT